MELSTNGRVYDFDCDLFTHVHDNLWVGGCPEGAPPEEFQTIISLYPWGNYKRKEYLRWHTFTMFDSGTIPDFRLLDYVSDLVVASMKGGMTLVHCQKGINRSNLVVVFALMKMGMQAREAIAMLRQKRSPYVLKNQVFEGWLLAYDMADAAGKKELQLFEGG